MDLSLEEIKEILSYNDLNKIINSLTSALNKTRNKINDLNIATNKINRAKNKFKYVPDFIVQTIAISGILHWNYQIELLIKPFKFKKPANLN